MTTTQFKQIIDCTYLFICEAKEAFRIQENTLKNKEITIDRLKKSIDDMVEQSEKLNAENEKLKERIDELENQLKHDDETPGRIVYCEKVLNKRNARIVNLEDEREKRILDMDKMSHENVELEQVNKNLKAEIEHLVAENAKWQRIAAETEKKLNQKATDEAEESDETPYNEDEIIVDWKTYVAVSHEGCIGCAFNDEGKCLGMPRYCGAEYRKDQRTIIWKLKPEDKPADEAEKAVKK